MQHYNPPQTPLNIIHRDDHVLVLSKPGGLLSVPGKDPAMHDCLELRARAEFPDALLVHRLDMSTSGLMVMAMTKDAQRNLGLQFERRKVEKEYIARIWGCPAETHGRIDLPLIVDWPNRPRQMVCHERGKPSQTDWEVLDFDGTAARVRLRPLTGRSHQLRVHMLALEKELGGHPILGDEFYAHPEAFQAADRLQLHAQRLAFYHPDGGAWTELEDPAPF